jgi:hypothetical protein
MSVGCFVFSTSDPVLASPASFFADLRIGLRAFTASPGTARSSRGGSFQRIASSRSDLPTGSSSAGGVAISRIAEADACRINQLLPSWLIRPLSLVLYDQTLLEASDTSGRSATCRRVGFTVITSRLLAVGGLRVRSAESGTQLANSGPNCQ